MTIEFERLGSGERRQAHEWLAEVRPHDRAPDDRPFLYLNMVVTADGRASVEGRTAALGSEADTRPLTELRALADAVLVGTRTIRTEGYGRLVRNAERIARREAAGLAATPTAVLLTRGFDIPWDAGLFAAADQPVIVYSGAPGDAPDVAAPVEVVPVDDPTPRTALADLRSRGVRSLLCEGGPTLNSGLFEAGLVDELFLTLAPQLTGERGAPRIVEGAGLPDAVGLRLEWVLRNAQELYLRYGIVR